MIVIIIGILLVQVGAALFLLSQLDTSAFHLHLSLACLATAAYLAAHCRQPGYANPEMVKLSCTQESELSASVEPAHTNSGSKMGREAEKAFCRYCKEDQLMRMKHCHDCKKCVATFDHHCLWIDNCVGEKNRPHFYLCLCLNLVEIAAAGVSLVAQMVHAGEWFPYQIAFLSLLGMLVVGVGMLVFMHSYLMIVNLTTWEYLRWSHIYYLLDLDRRAGSPFSRGFLGNIADYWTAGFQVRYRQWRLNGSALDQLKGKPDGQEGAQSGIDEVD